MDVPRKPATSEATQSRPRIVDDRASMRSAGPHHGSAPSGLRRAERIGRASSHAKYGMASVHSTVETTSWRPSALAVTSTERR
jgi:hypothetical protein